MEKYYNYQWSKKKNIMIMYSHVFLTDVTDLTTSYFEIKLEIDSQDIWYENDNEYLQEKKNEIV